jgi:TetR/AcrR family transcriptional regulator, cholesterol catabolism regulator
MASKATKTGKSPKAAKRPKKARRPLSPRRREVLDEAARLFTERGYGGTSMDDVANAVELTKGTLYHHFPGKAEILVEVYDEAADFVLANTNEVPADTPAPEAVRLLVRSVLELIEQRRNQVVLFHQEMPWVEQWLPPADARRVRHKMREYIDYVESVIKRGVSAGDFEKVDVHATAQTLIGMVTWSYRWWEPDGKPNIDQLTDLLTNIFLRGIAKS